MLIFVPMAGFGDRYKRAGYKEPKPLIPVDGKAMIERVLDAFRTEKHADDRYLFCVNKDHAENTDVLAVVERLRPGSKVVVIEPHKDGPIRTLLDCAHAIDDDDGVILNYCDFGVDWSYDGFRAFLAEGGWDGAMTAYKGFHPHSLGPTLYAYMKNEGDRVTEIREKHHFTSDKFQEYASAGLYYFRTGKMLKDSAKRLVERGERVNDEFYVSMGIQQLIEDGGKVGVYPLKHFYQWGTPEDLRDYEAWAKAMHGIDAFLERAKGAKSRSIHVIPMAGRGQRFADRGYADPKPLIPVAGPPMIAQALACLPTPTRRVLVAQAEHAKNERFKASVARLPAPTQVIELDHVTEGQACTARLGLEGVDPKTPVLFAPCDAGYVYDVEALLAHEGKDDADLVVFSAKGHLPAIWRPHMYGWLEVKGGTVTRVAVKKPVDGVPVAEQEVVTGTFWFKDVATFLREYDALLAANDRVNNEFYIDTIARRMVEGGARVRALSVDKYIPWGTPEELMTFDYWNEVFRGARDLGAKSP